MEPPGITTALVGHRGRTPVKPCRFGHHVGSCGEKIVHALFSTVNDLIWLRKTVESFHKARARPAQTKPRKRCVNSGS